MAGFSLFRPRRSSGGSALADLRPARVVVFIDHQNMYHRARAAFCTPDAPAAAGQIDPLALATLLAGRRHRPSRLTGVRVYRGEPHPVRQSRAHRAHRREFAACRGRAGELLTLVTRPLTYPPDWPATPAREKGIDVALAVDVVAMGLRDEYDVAIVASTDTDLEPAPEAVVALAGDPYPRCEVASWKAVGRQNSRLSAKGAGIWCHWLEKTDYLAVHDATDYAR